MKPEWCTQEIWERALAVQDKAIERCEAEKLAYRFPTCNGKSVLDEEVARALLDAHQRGMEEAAKVADNWGYECAAAIRAKAQEVTR